MTNQLVLTKPAATVRLGSKKLVEIKRAQDVIEGLAWASVVAVTVMFLLDGGAANFKDVPTTLNAISRLSSLIGTDLLLIHMLLVARVPWIDKFYGHDRATLAHKKLGKPVLYFIVAHFLASLISFAITEGKNVIATWWWLITDVPDMLTATIGLLLMVLVVVTSLNFARRKMSYEAWFLVHLLSYASVLVAVPHIFSTGSDIAGKPVQTIFWVTLYLFVAGNIIWYRVLKPLVAALAMKTRVSSVVRESSDTVSISISGRNLSKLGAQSGQFFVLRVMTPTQWWRAHPFSISATPTDSTIRFTIGNRGDDTALLQQIKPGTRVVLEGPYGVFTEERRSREKVVLVAAGIGIPPVRALAESIVARPGDVTVIYRVRNENDASLLAEMREICRIRGHRLFVLAGPRASNSSWMSANGTDQPDQARLTLMAPWVSESDVFVCGPQIWTEQVVKSALRAGAEPSRIHSEEYAW
jgi:predicted ferric reductase